MDFKGPKYGHFGVLSLFRITMLASSEVGIKKYRLTISILPGILKMKWEYSELYSDNLDVI